MSDSVALRAQAAVFTPVADGTVDSVDAQVPDAVAVIDGTTTTSEKSDDQATQNGVGAGSEQDGDAVKIVPDSADSKAVTVDGAHKSPAHNDHPAGGEIVAHDNQQQFHVNAAVYGGHGYNHGYPPAATGPMGPRPPHANYFANGATSSGPYMNGTAGTVVPQGQTLLSAGSDPISEGRRIYIGNLKYSVSRYDVKKLLRAFFVYNTVEKIYMPYSDTPLDPEHDGRFQNHGHYNDYAYGHNDQDGGRPTELPNKGYVFVTYGDAQEAEAAIQRLSGVMHFDRKLVCRPGLPKGVAFRSDDMGNGGQYRQNRNRRRNDELFSDNWGGHSGNHSTYGGYGAGAGRDSYGGGGNYFGSRGNGHYQQVGAFGNKGHYANDSGYPQSFGYRNYTGGYNGGYNYRGANNNYGGYHY